MADGRSPGGSSGTEKTKPGSGRDAASGQSHAGQQWTRPGNYRPAQPQVSARLMLEEVAPWLLPAMREPLPGWGMGKASPGGVYIVETHFLSLRLKQA